MTILAGPSAPTRTGWTALIVFALTPVAACGGGLALAPLTALAGLATARWEAAAGFARTAGPALWIAAVWLGYTALSGLWSLNSDQSQAVKLIAGLALGVAFIGAAAGSAADRRWVRLAGAGAVAILLGLLAVEALFGMPLNRLAQPDAIDWVLRRNPAKGLVALEMLSWGTAAWLLAQRPRSAWGWFAALLLARFALAPAFNLDAGLAAPAAGLVFFLWALAAPRAGLMAAAGALAGWILAAPFVVRALAGAPLPALDLPFSWVDRANMWVSAAARIFERPIFGWGMDSAREHTAPMTIDGIAHTGLQLHPHSLALQLWLETGAVGAVLAAAATLALAWRLTASLTRTQAAAAAGLIGAYSVFANVSFGAWQEWWIATPLMAAALIAAAESPRA